eukprot:jgi/Galph1/5803/GphlegSOOS_G4437.1
MITLKYAEVVPFQSEVFDPFNLTLLVENNMEPTRSKLRVFFIRDIAICDQEILVYEKEDFLLSKGSQQIYCHDMSLEFLKDIPQWEYCNVGCLVISFQSLQQVELQKFNLVVYIFTDRKYLNAQKQIFSHYEVEYNPCDR